jgi:hypothetical protein
MRNMMKLIGIIALAALTGFFMSGCEKLPVIDVDNTEDGFVPVTNITDVNTSVFVGTVSLDGRVVPSNATYKIIKWLVQREEDDINGTISGDKLTTTEEGDITVRATVENGIAVGKNFTKVFYITVDPFVAVSSIVYDGPANDEVGEIYLDATVYPDDASYTDIVWTVKDAGKTEATIKGDILTTKAEGRVVVRATIINGAADGKDYTYDFSIYVKDDDSDTEEEDF